MNLNKSLKIEELGTYRLSKKLGKWKNEQSKLKG